LLTTGDLLLERLCQLRGIEFTRIAESSGKSPDYWLQLGHHRLLAEVKTLDPNAEEAAINARRARGEIVAGGGTPGERLRREIREANRQLRTLGSAHGVPTILIVSNNTGCKIHTDPYSVMTAMQGLDVVDVTLPHDRSESPSFGPTHSGPERAMRHNANTSTSAIGILHDLDIDDVRLSMFHNMHAKVPLDPAVLRIQGVYQYKLPQGITSSLEAPWVEV